MENRLPAGYEVSNLSSALPAHLSDLNARRLRRHQRGGKPRSERPIETDHFSCWCWLRRDGMKGEESLPPPDCHVVLNTGTALPLLLLLLFGFVEPAVACTRLWVAGRLSKKK